MIDHDEVHMNVLYNFDQMRVDDFPSKHFRVAKYYLPDSVYFDC